MAMPKSPALFFGGIVVAIIALALAVYYMIPGPYHILSTHDFTSPQPAHALAFGALAVLCILAAVIARPRASQ